MRSPPFRPIAVTRTLRRRRPQPAALALLAALGACAGDGIAVPRAPDFAVLPMRLELAPGDTARLAAQIDRHAADAVQFLSRGTVASVTAAGLVSAVAPGEGSVTAVETREGIIYTVPVTVRGVRVRIDGAEPGSAGVRLAPGQAAALEAAVFGVPRGAADSVRWVSSDESVASVSADGTLRARVAGRAVLTASSVADPFLRGTAVVEVTPAGRGPALRLDVLAGRADADGSPSGSVGGTITVVVQADPAAFPAGARAELSLGGRVVGTRPLQPGGGALTFTVATAPGDSAAHDSAVGVARLPDGTHPLVVRVLTAGGALAGRLERPLLLRSAG
jgi:hypothetical protein